MPLKVWTGIAGVALLVAIVVAGLRLMRRIEDAAANAGISEGSTAVR